MLIIEIAAGYLACSIATFWLAQRDWRKRFDFTTNDLPFFLFISALGPVGLITALIKTFITWSAKCLPDERTVWRRYQ